MPRFFEEYLRLFGYVDFGMIFFIDSEEDYRGVFETDFIRYVLERKQLGDIRHIGFSSVSYTHLDVYKRQASVRYNGRARASLLPFRKARSRRYSARAARFLAPTGSSLEGVNALTSFAHRN